MILVYYLLDFMCYLYCKPGAYGVVTLPFSESKGINIFLAGFVPTANLLLGDESLTFKVFFLPNKILVDLISFIISCVLLHIFETPQDNAEEINKYARYEYPTMKKTLGGFKLQVMEGEFTDSQIVGDVGRKWTGKTTFIRMLVMSLSTVRILLHQLEIKIYCADPLTSEDKGFLYPSSSYFNFVSREDKPSVYLDSEQHIMASMMIKSHSLWLHAKKTAFVVEHDFIMATYLADTMVVYDGMPLVYCTYL
ncbi:ABC transporter E family member 2 [Bienertia sinuspersici]